MAYRKSQIPDFTAIRKEVEKIAVPELFAAVADYASKAREDFAARIEDQRFASFKVRLYPDSPINPNLSARWVRRKELAGADLRTMIATGWYLSKIDVHTRKGRSKSDPTMTFYIGFDSRLKARDLQGRIVSDMPLTRLAAIHEDGVADSNIPRRQHWGPQLNRMLREAPRVRRQIAKRIADALARSSRLRPFLETSRKRA